MHNSIPDVSGQAFEREIARNSDNCCQKANGTCTAAVYAAPESNATTVLPSNRCQTPTPRQIVIDGETKELTPSLTALLVARQLITLQQLAAMNEAKQKPKAKFLKTCKQTLAQIEIDVDRLCPAVEPKTRRDIIFELRRYVHKILTSSAGSYRVNTRLLDTMYHSSTRKHIKKVMNEGEAFKLAGNYSAPTDGRYETKDGKTAMSPVAKSKSYTLAVEMVPVDPTDHVPKAVFSQKKASATEALHKVLASSLKVGDDPEVTRRYWSTGHDSVVLVDSFVWKVYQDHKKACMAALNWFAVQDRMAENIGRLAFTFDSIEERDGTINAEIAAQVELRRAEFERRAQEIIAERNAAGKRFYSLKRHVDWLIAHYVDDVWRNIIPLLECIDGNGNPTVYRKLGRLYGPHTSAPRWLRKYLLIEHKDGELEALIEVDLGSCYYGILASLSGDSALIKAVHQGKVYELIHRVATDKFNYSGSYSECKAACNQHCLFAHGRAGFGTHVLFKAFRKLFPAAAAKVWHIRKGHAFAPSYLYRVLTEFEAAIMVEGVIPRLIVEGVPVLNLHDGVLVPASSQERVLQIMTAEASRRLGFRARVSAKPCVPEAQAVPTVDATDSPMTEQPEAKQQTAVEHQQTPVEHQQNPGVEQPKPADGMLFDRDDYLSVEEEQKTQMGYAYWD